MYGRPGDNPINDIIHHNRAGFGEEFDGLIRAIGQHPYYGMVKRELEAVCIAYMHAVPTSEEDRAVFKTSLKQLLERLEARAYNSFNTATGLACAAL